MDYEKKYNEALERAKELVAKWSGKNKDFYIEDYSYIFPELLESEDERIRKRLIEALKTSKTVGELKFILPEPTREECIAYLEKQKEQKHPNGCFTCDEYKKGYEAGRSNGFTAGYNKAMKEQKPAEWSDTNELVFKDICKHLKEEGYGGWIVLLNALRNGEFQPKQEWSEEQEEPEYYQHFDPDC